MLDGAHRAEGRRDLRPARLARACRSASSRPSRARCSPPPTTSSPTFVGRGCHGAFPHLGRDPIVTACEAVLNLQQFVSREIDPTEPAVVTVGKFNAGTATNVIPDTATIEGTARTLTPRSAQADRRGDRAPLRRHRRRPTTATLGSTWIEGYPPTINDPAMADYVATVARQTLGPDRFIPVARPSMGGEDFAYYLEKVPGCFFLVGVEPPGPRPTTRRCTATATTSPTRRWRWGCGCSWSWCGTSRRQVGRNARHIMHLRRFVRGGIGFVLSIRRLRSDSSAPPQARHRALPEPRIDSRLRVRIPHRLVSRATLGSFCRTGNFSHHDLVPTSSNAPASFWSLSSSRTPPAARRRASARSRSAVVRRPSTAPGCSRSRDARDRVAASSEPRRRAGSGRSPG